MLLEYVPEFEHKDWIDQLDRVRASGEDGFNARFHAISSEFNALATIVRTIGVTLDALAAGAPVTPVTLTLTPLASPQGSPPWAQGDGVVKSPPGADQCVGFLPLVLPNGVRLVSFTALGQATGDSLAVVRLERQPLAGEQPGERIASVEGTGGSFSRRADIAPSALATVDNAQFKYRVRFQWNWRADVDQTAVLSTFQLVHVQP
jgi:hypothetical protein